MSFLGKSWPVFNLLIFNIILVFWIN